MPGAKSLTFYILGASGFLGQVCVRYLRSQGHKIITKRVEVTDPPALKKAFRVSRPQVVINFSGVRAYPNIDWCEDHQSETMAVNVTGAINAMLAALEAKAYPIQISSGCIYQGGPKKLFTEDDPPNFFGSFYSRMRIVTQEALRELPVLQARIRMPLSGYTHPRNFIDKIISYPKVISIPNSVTLLEDLFPALELLVAIRPIGLLNLTNDGYIEHQKVLEAYKRIVNPKHSYQLISLEELQGKDGITKAQRSNCVLSNAKAKSLGLSLPALDDNRLNQVMLSFKASLKSAGKMV